MPFRQVNGPDQRVQVPCLCNFRSAVQARGRIGRRAQSCTRRPRGWTKGTACRDGRRCRSLRWFGGYLGCSLFSVVPATFPVGRVRAVVTMSSSWLTALTGSGLTWRVSDQTVGCVPDENQAAVVAVEARLYPVGCHGWLAHFHERERCCPVLAAGQHVIGQCRLDTVTWGRREPAGRGGVLCGYPFTAEVADAGPVASVVHSGKVVIHAAVRVDLGGGRPGASPVGGPGELNVVLAAAVVLPGHVDRRTGGRRGLGPGEIVGANERSRDTLFRSAAEVALRLPGGDVAADPGRSRS